MAQVYLQLYNGLHRLFQLLNQSLSMLNQFKTAKPCRPFVVWQKSAIVFSHLLSTEVISVTVLLDTGQCVSLEPYSS